jgi:hypothetical protein
VLAIFYIALFIVNQRAEYNSGDKIKEKEMGWTNVMYGQEEKCVPGNLRERPRR